ncbi:MAG: GntR family transcriptional regulator [Bacillota bacterium]|uniref:DNA-binding transcriptional regulator YhcF, GntR family n=1 Tax=[Clostridium] aminophilum TaxID=1526 RepID=A0A1I6KAE0_9FIRM|nr:GntR family transcriptional regulator [[Clostridium] aminophilum]MCR4628736.1 GntR family transcriptional regulator [Clostridium sp.]MDT3843661.1 GntR family transcriptional regulator [Bacillota bacterium]MDD6196789.1 GntR family transcriptional regulator [[Clostridium] aminophilum]SET35272.1 DNA-binding transcriptional regulator YhcF, GntR family [[Clostridium] aminophilum]SFR88147.1 DNA-binding transcriptional regulator YhcF, GntR family [[Clostridium] aminophilum]
MIVEVDFNSDEALYIQLRNQIIVGIACDRLLPGDTLPSVRQLASDIGINMHTVNKAYAVLRQEGFVKLDRRKGAVIAVDEDKMKTLAQIRHDMGVLLAAASCKNVTREEIHRLVDSIYDEFPCQCRKYQEKKQEDQTNVM